MEEEAGPDSGPDSYGAFCLATWAAAVVGLAVADLAEALVAAVVEADLADLAAGARAVGERAEVGSGVFTVD